MVVLDNVFFGHSLWPFAEGNYLGFNFFVMKSCQTLIIPKKHPSPKTFSVVDFLDPSLFSSFH